MSMLTQQRHEQILKLLSEKGSVTVSELTELLNSSESTIRRDLLTLDKMGRLNKVHGGATLTEQEFIRKEDEMETKLILNVEAKRKIAKYAASQIADGDFIYIDAGSTTLLMTEYITATDVSFVTSGIAQAKELVKRGYRTYILAGELKSTTEAVAGISAAQNLMNYNFTKGFFGTNGVHVKRGFTTPDPDEAYVKSAAIDRCFVSYVLADSSKFDKVTTMTFEKIQNCAIITEKKPDESYENMTVIKTV